MSDLKLGDKGKLCSRMYENKFPEVEESVMVNVKSIEDMGAYVTLLEYNNIEGMILMSELSRRRIRSVSKIIRVGRTQCVVVMRVDKEKGYIDLSKRRVSVEEVAKCEEKYNKSKTVHSIMRHVAELLDRDLEELYGFSAWPLYRTFGHAYDAFKLAVSEPEKVFGGLNIPEDVLELLLKIIRRRLTPQPVKIRADIVVSCFKYEGIDAVKNALRAGEKISTETNPITIKLVAAPDFVMFTASLDKNSGISALVRSIDAIKEDIEAHGGSLTVKQPPRCITEREETQFEQMLTQLEHEGPDEDEGESSESEEEDEKDKK